MRNPGKAEAMTEKFRREIVKLNKKVEKVRVKIGKGG